VGAGGSLVWPGEGNSRYLEGGYRTSVQSKCVCVCVCVDYQK